MSGHIRAVALAAALLPAALGQTASAQDVELRSFDGTVELEGNLIAYDGAYYQIDTVYGTLTVSAEGVSCAGPGCPDLTSFVAEARIAGAATVAEGLLPDLLAAFAAQQGMTATADVTSRGTVVHSLLREDGQAAARFIVTPGSTDDGFLALLNGEVDIALALREPDEAERIAARDQAPDDPPLTRRVRVLALDALVPVVSAGNPASALPMADLARLFSGEVVNWADLGGPDAPVALHLLSTGLGPAQDFADRVLMATDRPLSATIVRHDSAADLARAVARDAFAVGITSRSAAGAARVLPLTGACGFSQTATADAVKSEDYPLTAPVYLYLAPYRLPQLVRQFLAFTETEEAGRILQNAGYVNQDLTRTPLSLQGERIRNAVLAAGDEVTLEDVQAMLRRLGSAERLSPTFRFGDGAAELDTQSRAAVGRLATAIETGLFDGRTLLFVGFSDSAGTAQINTRLAARRAETVLEAVRAAADGAGTDRVTLRSVAFGEAMPMACEDTDWGRAVNRRVEVWVE
ncbi:phosphate ABC transporter substrate-binding/OmpA family protein [Roseibacterium sp. SDUM158016]|uniref:phosphate ABC transporter substrate-binding/OmpA family protein n=1 Tax=Roseicyclus sediminis TaxID=2980997 RepID=UPI0021D09AFA|nr:phosphate ABC transporter substrate-binding/OmpA family protein [Roseibacterium sp. SDUM158016]MCU4652197.1 phosphate ABC transporter substrate-binding/OmpA family protein [Roseibacterium sp. SDUM158016]